MQNNSPRRNSSARFFASFIDYPKTAFVFFVLISLVALGGYVRPNWPQEVWERVTTSEQERREKAEEGASNRQTFEQRGPRNTRRRVRTISGESLGRADAFLVIRSPVIFTREGSSALREIVSSLESLSQVARVRSIEQAPPLNIFGLPEPILPRGQATPQRFALSKEKAIKHPLVVGQLMSPDAETTLVEVQFEWLNVRDDADCTTSIIETARAAKAKHPSVPMEIDLTGPVPFRLMLIQNESSNEVKYQIIGYGMIFVMAAILFRGVTVVLVVASAPVIGVWWTLGMLRYLELQNNPFSTVILPVLLSLVGFTDGVHMMVHIRSELAKGIPPREACKNTLGMVGLACLLTSLTTAIGMGSLLIAHHKIVREFGLSCVIGVTATWISVMLVIPLVCCTRWSRLLAKGADNNSIDRYLNHIGSWIHWCVQHARLVSFSSIAMLIVLSGITLTLKPDDRKSNRLPNGSPEQRALEHLDRSMGGLDICEVTIQWNQADRAMDDIAGVISKVDTVLRSEPLIGHPLSLCRLIEALPGEGTAVEKISMAELLPPPLKQALVSMDNRTATVVFRCQDLGTATYKPTFERVEAALDSISKENNVSISLSGDPISRWRDLYQIVMDLISSLGTASIVIFCVMGFAYRSLRIGLISVVPNLLPLAATASFLAITGQPLEIVGVCSFTICLGIAVDDTIHFLSRYQEEMHKTTDHHLAIERSFHGVGTGMIMTTLVLVAGFSSVLTSDTRDHRVFALLGVITLASALLCDLFLLPALLAYFDKPKMPQDPTPTA